MDLAPALDCLNDAVYDEYHHTFRASTAAGVHDSRRKKPRFYYLEDNELDELNQLITEAMRRLSEVSVEVQLLLEKRREK
jgi:hypothetical protein